MRTRLLAAPIALVLGVAFSFAMYRWHPPYTNPSPGQTKIWIVTAIPFAGLAVTIVWGLRRSAAAIGWIVLAALTGLAYYAAGANRWDSVLNTAALPLGLEVFYGAIVLGHLLRFRESRSRPAGAGAPTRSRVMRYGLVLLVATVIATLPCLVPWTDETGSTVAFCLAVIAPVWLSTVFILAQWARNRASTLAARVWLAATLLCLPLLFFGVLLSHVTLNIGGE